MGRVRLLLKKRGHRWTGSGWLGSVGEGAVFVGFLLAGLCSLIVLMVSRLVPIPGLSDLAFDTGGTVALIVILASLFAIGAGGLGWTVFQLRTSQERRSDFARRAAQLTPSATDFPPARDYPTIPFHDNLFNSPGTQLALRLPSRGQPAWSLLGAVTFCAMWNVLFCLAVVSVTSRTVGNPVRGFVIPVALALGYMGYRSTLFAVRRWGESIRFGPTHVEVSALPFYPGRKYEVAVIQFGKRPLQRLVVQLVCDEETKYREGTDARIERRRVREIPFLEVAPVEFHDSQPWIGRQHVVCPADAMHSFQSGSNSIEWSISVKGSVDSRHSFQRDFAMIMFTPPPKSTGKV